MRRERLVDLDVLTAGGFDSVREEEEDSDSEQEVEEATDLVVEGATGAAEGPAEERFVLRDFLVVFYDGA